MWRASWILMISVSCGFFWSNRLAGQINDCVGAQVICSDGPVDYQPSGPGRDDFANPKNQPGCLLTREAQSAWYYFEFRRDMPPNSVIEFTITPEGFGDDFDFAIYGPDLNCDSLGNPVRCSFAAFNCTFCPQTGLGRGATDTSEPANGSDGFVAPMVVQPGEGYYLLIDNFKFNAKNFRLTWGGSAAPYLNCLANPACRNITVAAGPNRTVCAGSPPFRLEGSARGAIANARFEWLGTPEALRFLNRTDVLQPTLTIPANFSGTLQYILSVVNGNCALADDVEITVSDSRPPQISGNRLLCSGASTVLDAGAGYLRYRWSNGDTTRTITVINPGNYTVTVTNAANCTSSNSIEVMRAAAPQPSITGGTIICLDDPLRLDAGAGFTSYRWSSGATTRTLDVRSAGTYRVTVTDQNGCSGEAEVSVTEARKPNAEVTGDSFICFGQSTTLRTTQLFQSYRWSDGSTAPTLSVSASGTYAVIVTDANGCRDTAQFSVVRNPQLNISITGERNFCAGGSTRLSVGGNFASYRWSNNDTSSTISVNASGVYSLTVTDANGCEAAATATVTENPLPTPVLRAPAGICPGETVRIETDPVQQSYRWSNGATTPSIEVDRAGTYTLDVTSAAGCVGMASVTLAQFPEVRPEVRGDLTFCPDVGGVLTTTRPFARYLWSNGDTLANTRVFADGTYAVTVTDANGCSGKASITVDAYEVQTPPVSKDTSFCSGATLVLDAKVNFPRYRWSTGDTTRVINLTRGGVFTLTVTDANGCNANATFTVTERPRPDLRLDGSNRLCPGDTVEVRATGNFNAIRWSDNVTTPVRRIFLPGDYGVVVTDASGCTNEARWTVTGAERPAPAIIAPSVICNRQSVSLNAGAGWARYRWNNGAQTPQIIINQGGVYTVEVEDANGCRGMASITIAERNAPPLDIVGAPFFCQAGATKLEATPGNYRYRWSNGANNPSIFVNRPGIYSITVEDEAGCTSEKSIEVREIPLPNAVAGTDTALDCNITRIRLGGTTATNNLEFLWNGPGINDANRRMANPEITLPGEYMLVAIDKTYGCQSEVRTVRVSDRSYRPSIRLQTSGELDCRTPSVVIDASQSQRGNNIIYQWRNERGEPIGNSPQLMVNQPGKYFFQVTDNQLGCTNQDSVRVLGNYDLPNAAAGADQTLTCSKNEATLDGSASANGSAMTYRWTTPNGNLVSGANTRTATVNQPGVYILTVLNTANGCSNTDSVLVVEDRTPPAVNLGNEAQLDCDIPQVRLENKASNPSANLRYNWSTNSGFKFDNPNLPTVSVNKPGLYTLQITNLNNGCTAVASVNVVDVSNPPVAVQTKLFDPLCKGDSTGQIVIEQVTGGTAPFVYSLNGAPFESVDRFNRLPAGEYRLTVEDAAGCRQETKVLLRDGMTLIVTLSNDLSTIFKPLDSVLVLEPAVNVPRRNIVRMRWEVLGEVFDTSVVWRQTVRPKSTGFYKLTVVNDLGCIAADSVWIRIDSSANIYVPTAFSPNSDGYNDVFMIYSGPESLKINYLRIFDRWGNQVFQTTNAMTNDPMRGWDGNSNGKKQNADVYVFVAEIVLFGEVKQVLAGEVNLIR